jgi:hypothetical protein
MRGVMTKWRSRGWERHGIAGVALAVVVAMGCSEQETTSPTGALATSSSSGGSAGMGGQGGEAAAGGMAGGGEGGGGTGGTGGSGGGVCAVVAPGPTRGAAVALAADDATLVVANRDAGSVTVLGVDYQGGLPAFVERGEVQLGGEPWQVAIDGCGERAYVVLRKDQKLVEIVDLLGTPTKGQEVAVGSEPTGLALSPTNASVLVANWVDGTVSMVDAATMTVVKTHDLNTTLAATGLLGSGVVPRPALAHPRSIAITNDGDGDDTDETMFVTEFFAQRTEAELGDGSNADTDWEALVYTVDLGDDTVGTVDLASITDTGFPANNAATGCFPNQLQSITIAGDLVYVTSICASPRGPTSPQTMTHPAVHAFRADDGTTVDVANLNQELATLYAMLPMQAKRFPLVANDIDFVGGTGEAYVTANGTDAVFRLLYDSQGALVSVGGDTAPFVDLAPASIDPTLAGQNPIGIVVAHAQPFAFVANDVSRNVTAIDLDPALQEVAGLSANDPRVMQSADLPSNPADQARLRGKRAFDTGLGRWSLNGEGWGACQSCHFEGLSDDVTWYLGRGPRQSTSLDGSFASNDPTDARIFNWTAVNDEMHDFENVARGLDGAVGALVQAISNPPVNADRINLGDTIAFAPAGAAGLNGSAAVVDDTVSLLHDWDDIELYVSSLRSPRAPTNIAAADVTAGATLFETHKCDGCHGGAKWTVSHRFYVPSGATNEALLATQWDALQLVADGFPAAVLPAPSGFDFMRGPNPKSNAFDQIVCVLRAVGTYGVAPVDVGIAELRADMITPSQGNEPNGKGYNVPSLLGLGVGAPYFHAGNARTLEEALSAMFVSHHAALSPGFAPTASDLQGLVAFLLSIDEDKSMLPLPGTAGADGGDFCAAP